jgi:hypothetical protein
MRTATGLSSVIHVIRHPANAGCIFPRCVRDFALPLRQFTNSASGRFELAIQPLFHFSPRNCVLEPCASGLAAIFTMTTPVDSDTGSLSGDSNHWLKTR